MFASLLTRPYFKGNSGLLNIESNRVQSLIFTWAVFQVLRKMYAHNLKIKRDLPSKLKFDCNSSLSSAGTKGSHEKRARRRSKSFLNASDCRINWNTGITKGREKSIEIQ